MHQFGTAALSNIVLGRSARKVFSLMAVFVNQGHFTIFYIVICDFLGHFTRSVDFDVVNVYLH